MLKNPPGRNESQTLINEDTAVRYVNYTNDESPDEDNDGRGKSVVRSSNAIVNANTKVIPTQASIP